MKTKSALLVYGLPALLACTLSGLSFSAKALIYSCQDKSGRTLVSDLPIQECATQPLRVLRNSGVSKVIPAPLTAEQKQQLELEKAQKLQTENAEREKSRKDKALLASYSSPAQIEAARQRALIDANELITNSNERLAALEKERKANEMDALQYKDKPMPVSVQAKFEATEAAILLEQKSLATSKAELNRINQKYDAEKQRFIQLTASDTK